MTLTYATQIRLAIRSINVGAQKIDGALLKTHRMVSTKFLVQDKEDRYRFFEETFLLADINMEVILSMPFLSLSNIDINFNVKDPIWRSYIAVEILPITSWVKLIDKREFVKTALDKNSKTFVMHVTAMVATKADGIKVYLF